MRILLINGPNLNTLGSREPEIYGKETLDEIVGRVQKRAEELGAELTPFQSNHEGAIIDFIQSNAPTASGIVINAASLTHTSVGLRDAIAGSGLPAIEVHISNIYTRERFRHHSYISPVARGVIVGLRWRGYVYALEALVDMIREGR